MLNTVAVVLTSLGVGSLLGVFGKAVLDKRQLKFSKAFEFKEKRYQALMILMWVAMNPNEHEFTQLQSRRPDLQDAEALGRELELEYHNAMLFASDKVLDSLAAFMSGKSQENWRVVTRAMKKDLYL